MAVDLRLDWVAFVAASLIFCQPLSAEDSQKVDAQVRNDVMAFLEITCFKCHDEAERQGDVRLDELLPSLADPASAQLWQDVLDVINVGEMPPEDEEVDEVALANAIGELTEDLLKARKLMADTGGEIVLRRLTEAEYINSIRFLTGVSLPDELVPDDESGIDFNTLGHYQTFSPAMLEQYEQAARYAVKHMLTPIPSVKPTVIRSDEWKTKRKQKERTLAEHVEAHAKAKKVPEGTTDFKPYGFLNDARFKNAFKLSAPDGFYQPPLRHYLANPNTKTGVVLYQASMGPLSTGIMAEADVETEYIFRARVAAEPGMPEEAKILRLTNVQNKQKRTLGYFHVRGTLDEPEIVEMVVRPEPGKFNLQLGFSDLFGIRKENTAAIKRGETIPGYWVDWMELEGPTFSKERAEARKEIFPHDVIADTHVREALATFASRAFRGKAVDDSLIDQLMHVYQDERDSGSSESDAVVAPLTMVLSSPAFLYLGEAKNDTDVQLTGAEFATRLSYMLWKEPASPDLLANSDRLLLDTEFLSSTIDRMMADPKFDRFIREFFGQWLHLRKYDALIFEKAKVAEFGKARKHFAKEQLFHFVQHVIANDLSLTNLIDSDFTLLNGTMATFYDDLDVGLLDDAFVPVPLPGEARRRGGILGMAVIQAMGSTGEHTSPVERGAFILRKLLNASPPPPPPNVPQIGHDDPSLSIREKLEAHKAIPQCVSCHRKMDDMGLAMEQFSVIGMYRESENGERIRTAGLMHDGRPFKDFSGMKAQLAEHRDAMIESMVEALIAYSFGREHEFSDQDFVASVVDETKSNGYRFRDLLKSFVRHERFAKK